MPIVSLFASHSGVDLVGPFEARLAKQSAARLAIEKVKEGGRKAEAEIAMWESMVGEGEVSPYCAARTRMLARKISAFGMVLAVLEREWEAAQDDLEWEMPHHFNLILPFPAHPAPRRPAPECDCPYCHRLVYPKSRPMRKISASKRVVFVETCWYA